jgi:thiosulfate reductase cytochrome b subunit
MKLDGSLEEKKVRLTCGCPATYRICIQGHLDENWLDYLQGMKISVDDNEEGLPVTVLTGLLLDQAALMGILNSLYDHRQPILSVECLSMAGA